jgi:hypothetical protein
MTEIPSFPYHTFAQEILRSIANLSDEHVEEVFQGIARMPQISSVVLDRMVGLLSDIFEDSMDVLLPCRGGQTPNREAPKSPSEHPTKGCVTRSIAKAGKEDARMKMCDEEDTNVRTDSKNKRTMVPVHQHTTLIHTTLIHWAMSLRPIILSEHMMTCSIFLS